MLNKLGCRIMVIGSTPPVFLGYLILTTIIQDLGRYFLLYVLSSLPRKGYELWNWFEI